FFVPLNLATFHPYPTLGAFPIIYNVAPILVLTIAVGTLYSLKFTRMIFFGMAVYMAGILLTLQFIQVGSAIVSERYTYLAYIGLSLVLIYFIDRYFFDKGQLNPIATGVLGVWLLAMGYFTFQQTKVWENSETLWNQVIKVYPNSAVAYNNLGNFLSDEGRHEEALGALNQSIALRPDYPKALNSRGKTYRLLGRANEALMDFNRSIELDPNDGDVYSNRGNVYFGIQQFELALADYNKALEFDPYNDKAIGNSGSIYFQQGQYQQAIEKYTQAIQLNAAYADAYLNRGASYAVTNQGQAALNDFSAYLQLNQRNWRAWYWRGLEYQKIGQHQAAINDFNQAGQLIDPVNQAVIQQAIAQSQAALR
ncbi:MAG: tetratricopeptide repeat protein, partial [Bacteroidota bacterium]